MYQAVKIAVVILLVLYPVSIYLGLQYFSPAKVGMFLLVVFALRMLLAAKQGRYRNRQLLLTVAIGVLLAGLTWIFDTEKYLLWYPVALSSVFFVVFSSSLIYPPTAIETIARIREPDLNEAGVAYTRKVTVVWTLFFLINTLIATWTVLIDDMQVWTLYNGLLSYIAIGILFGAEMLIRRRLRKQEH